MTNTPENTGTGDGGAATPWYETALAGQVDSKGVPMRDAIVGHFQNRGLLEKTPAEVAVAMALAHREAEALIGAPAGEMVRWPKDAADEANWKVVNGRLGVPETADAYDLKEVKLADGADLDPGFEKWVRDTAASLRLPAAAGAELAKAIIGFAAKEDTEVATQAAERQAAEEAKLKANWGANYEGNKLVAQNALNALGVKDMNNISYSEAMDMFRRIGAELGEDKFIKDPAGGNSGGIMTREQAIATLDELKRDKAAAARWLDGDSAEVRKWNQLHVIIAGDDTEESRRRSGQR